MDSKTYTMLNTVKGSRDGIKVETFTKGQTYDLNPELAEQFYHQGAVEEVGGTTANARQTKVVRPAETKVVTPPETKAGEAGVDLDTQNVEELVALARDHYGLDVDTTMDEAELRRLIDRAAGTDADKDTDADDHSDLAKMTKKQLVAHAKEKHGLDLDMGTHKDEMIAAIEARAGQ